jgi:hypothetical protein
LDEVEPIIQELKPLKMPNIQPEASASQPPLLMSAHPLPLIQAQDENIEMYRRVQCYKPPLDINSIDEARAILAKDASNASANRYLGWWSLTHNEPLDAIFALDKATMSSMMLIPFHEVRLILSLGPLDSQSWYLLGRAYLQLYDYYEVDNTSELHLAHRSLQAAIWEKGWCPIIG